MRMARYGCYEEISSTHTARNCPKPRECKICLGDHPNGLHGFKFCSKKADGNKSSTDDDKTVKVIVHMLEIVIIIILVTLQF